jgi:hypothetical protein
VCGKTGVLVVGFIHVHSGVGPPIGELWPFWRVLPGDILAEHRCDGEAPSRHGPKWMAAVAMVHSDHRMDPAHHLVCGAGEGKSVWESCVSGAEFGLTVRFMGDTERRTNAF